VKGLISTRWEKGTGGRFSLSVRVPANTRATIYLPILSAGKATLTESGKRLWPESDASKIPGVLSVQEEGSSVKCLVAAGQYRFIEAPLPP
jgi:hypothetical protein